MELGWHFCIYKEGKTLDVYYLTAVGRLIMFKLIFHFSYGTSGCCRLKYCEVMDSLWGPVPLINRLNCTILSILIQKYPKYLLLEQHRPLRIWFINLYSYQRLLWHHLWHNWHGSDQWLRFQSVSVSVIVSEKTLTMLINDKINKNI